MRRIAQRSGFADAADGLTDLVGLLGEAERGDECHHEGDGERAREPDPEHDCETTDLVFQGHPLSD